MFSLKLSEIKSLSSTELNQLAAGISAEATGIEIEEESNDLE